MANRLALVFCVHHKPWLMQSTLVTTLLQDLQAFDVFVLYNVGGGGAIRADAPGMNQQLSPFDERVRGVCALSRPGVHTIEYQNDESLDSGAWYKFIRDGRWRDYDWVLFIGEGTLLAREQLLSSMLTFAPAKGVHVIASGHEKRRIPKDQFLRYRERHDQPTPIDRLEDQMIAEAFAIFSRDPAFRRVLEDWHSDFAAETQNHVPAGGPPSSRLRALRSRWIRTFGSPAEGGLLRELPWRVEARAARRRMSDGPAADGEAAPVFVGGQPQPAERVVSPERVNGVAFHREAGPEWFGCATNHLMSRTFLERFHAKLDEFAIWDVLQIRFAGTPLEVIWGLVPQWLGFEKWFTDGFHRVRKDFYNYLREDTAPEMATYINRYYPGTIAVDWRGDYLKVKALRPGLERLRTELPSIYF